MRKRIPLVIVLLIYAIQLVIVSMVLLHDFENADSAVIAALLVVIYGMSSAGRASETALADTRFLATADLAGSREQATPGDGDSALSGQNIKFWLKRDMPYAWASAIFNILLAGAGVVKVLYLTAGIDAAIWLSIAVGVILGGWLLLEALVFIFKSRGFAAKLSVRDWFFLTPVLLVLIFVLVRAVRLILLNGPSTLWNQLTR